MSGLTLPWLRLKRLAGLPTATADHEGQIRYNRDGNVTGKLWLARHISGNVFEWVEVQAGPLTFGTGAGQPAEGNHTHPGILMREVHAQRDAVTSGGATISSTSGAPISGLSDTMVLADGVKYDIVVIGHAQLSAGTGGSVSVAIDISGTGINWNPVYIGTPTEGGERGVMPTARLTSVDGVGQTVTVQMLGKRVTSNGTIGSASFQGFAIPRNSG